MEDAKVDAVKQFNRPITKKDIKAFLGLPLYYRRFISNYGTISAVLSDLTRNREPVIVL